MENRSSNFQVILIILNLINFFIWNVFYFYFLNYRVTDLQIMKDKADKDNYKNVEDFRADILTFVHNIIIFHGGKLTSYISCIFFS